MIAKYKVGDRVQANDWSGAGKWRPCQITSLSPQRFRSSPAIMGYYVQWLDVSLRPDPITGVLESQGGWHPETNIR